MNTIAIENENNIADVLNLDNFTNNTINVDIEERREPIQVLPGKDLLANKKYEKISDKEDNEQNEHNIHNVTLKIDDVEKNQHPN